MSFGQNPFGVSAFGESFEQTDVTFMVKVLNKLM
jgi:hypothetical protein